MYNEETLELLKKLSADIKAKTKIKQIHPCENAIIVKISDIDSPVFAKMKEYIQDDKPVMTIKFWAKEGKLHYAKDIQHYLLKNDIAVDRFEFLLDKNVRGIDESGHYYDSSSYLITSKWFNKNTFRHKEEYDIIDSINKIIERVENSFQLYYSILTDVSFIEFKNQQREFMRKADELRNQLSEVMLSVRSLEEKQKNALKIKIDMLKDF